MNLFELFATISLDSSDYEKQLNNAERSSINIASKIGSGFKTLAKGTAIALGATATAVSAITKQSFDNFAEYEQLAGGAKLLWGDAYDFVADKAKNAYATVQMSQNDYLQQMNGFSTGLKEALGGNAQQASELADKIITAEADIVSATGVSQEAVQNAFNGIMKSNFTMLDNLQLGIKPTKEGMQEVINKMNEWNKVQGKSTNYQMGNLADMQSALVDYVSYVGMAGYAQAEASDTIQGSLAMTKSAWSNFLTALADPEQSITEAINGVIKSAKAFAKNSIPVIKEAIKGISKAITELLPMVMNEIPTMINETLPELNECGVQMLDALINGIVDNLDQIVDMLIMIALKISDAILNNLPKIVDAGFKILIGLITGITEAFPKLAPQIVNVIVMISKVLIENLPLLIQATYIMITELGKNLITMLGSLFTELTTAINTATGGLFDDIKASLSEFINHPLETIAYLYGYIIGSIERFRREMIEKLITFLFVELPKKWEDFKDKLQKLPAKIEGFFKNLPENFKKIGSNIVNGLWEGIKAGWTWLTEKVTALVNSLTQGVEDALEVRSPSRVFKRIGAYTAEGFGIGWEDEFSSVKNNILSGMDFASMSTNSMRSMLDKSAEPVAQSQPSIENHVTVTLEGDAKRLFKMMQSESSMYNQTTGRSAFA